ncbi:hypothetical protein HRQ65_10000 [Tatlockia micdadei]|uniref:C2 family cysteine protease n=1 Tax=Legionella micdadei TaxID=451 RepID=UPI0015703621|nr:C2 family cysteine protease [Legionella micdadei]NSL18715.1 hypothetical protein [Legionella micdadei]
MPRFERGLLPAVADKSNVARVFPGVRGQLRKEITVSKEDGQQITLDKKAKVIIQPINFDKPDEPQRFKLTHYKDNTESADSTLPESQNDIIILGSYDFTADRKPSKYFKFTEHYERRDEPLFKDGSPTIDEISQGQIPDCFLLAAVQSILNHPEGEAFIRGMMRQNEDGTVTVRLFDSETLEPVYITVSAAVLANRAGSLSHHKALWVYVLENAYAARAKDSANKQVDASIATVFSGGGHSSTAFKVLTGLNAQHQSTAQRVSPVCEVTKFLSADDFDFFKDLVNKDSPTRNRMIYSVLLNYLPKISKIYEGAGAPSAKAEEFRNDKDGQRGIADLIKEESNPDQALSAFYGYYTYLSFYLKHKGECDRIFSSDKKETDKLLDLIEFAAKNDEAAVAPFLQRYFNHISVPVAEHQVHGTAPAFSGYYQKEQYEQFQAIKQALAEGKLVAAGTNAKFSEDVPGVRNRHAYTVLDVEERKVTGEDEERTICYLKLRNPWGTTGRVYQQKEGTFDFEALEEAGADTFEIELTDFYKYFSSFYISDSANERFAYNQEREILYGEIHSALTNLKIGPDSTLDNLADFNEQYKKCYGQLIKLELMHLDKVDPAISQSVEDIFAHGYEAELEERAVKGLLADVPMDFYAGDEESKKDYLFSLLKLRWLMKQESPDPVLLAEVKDKVIKQANFDIYQILAAKKMIADLVASGFARACLNELKEFNELFEKTTRDMQAADLRHAKEDKLSEWTANLLSMERIAFDITTRNAVLRNLGTPISDEEFEKLNRDLNKIKGELEAVNNISALSEELKLAEEQIIARATEACENDRLPEKEKDRIIQVAHELRENPKSQEAMKKLAEDYSTSENKEKQELGEEMSTMASLGQQLVQFWEILKALVGRARRMVFFVQDYEVGPKPTYSSSEEYLSSEDDPNEDGVPLPPFS